MLLLTNTNTISEELTPDENLVFLHNYAYDACDSIEYYQGEFMQDKDYDICVMTYTLVIYINVQSKALELNGIRQSER